jgi:hypothetical protein
MNKECLASSGKRIINSYKVSAWAAHVYLAINEYGAYYLFVYKPVNLINSLSVCRVWWRTKSGPKIRSVYIMTCFHIYCIWEDTLKCPNNVFRKYLSHMFWLLESRCLENGRASEDSRGYCFGTANIFLNFSVLCGCCWCKLLACL